MYSRGKKHMEALKTATVNKNKTDLDNGLVAHYIECHEGEETRFKMDVAEKFERPMQRQIVEGVAIHRSIDIGYHCHEQQERVDPASHL